MGGAHGSCHSLSKSTCQYFGPTHSSAAPCLQGGPHLKSRTHQNWGYAQAHAWSCPPFARQGRMTDVVQHACGPLVITDGTLVLGRQGASNM